MPMAILTTLMTAHLERSFKPILTMLTGRVLVVTTIMDLIITEITIVIMVITITIMAMIIMDITKTMLMQTTITPRLKV